MWCATDVFGNHSLHPAAAAEATTHQVVLAGMYAPDAPNIVVASR